MGLLTTICLSFSLLVTVSIGQLLSGNENQCFTPDNLFGICVTLDECPEIVQLYNRKHRSPQAKIFLQEAQRNCGRRVRKGVPVVCCTNAYSDDLRADFDKPITQNPNNPFLPKDPVAVLLQQIFTNPTPTTTSTSTTTTTTTPTPFISASTSATLDNKLTLIQKRATGCNGPDSRPGSCKNLAECGEFAQRLKDNPNDKTFIELLRQSNKICRARAPIICCPNSAVDTKILSVNPTIKPIQTSEARILTPAEGCGQSGVSHRRIVGGNPSQPGSWPWIALLGEDNGFGEIEFVCGGSLITKRHVVTAAHCINKRLRVVRLGEHNLSTDTEALHRDVRILRTASHPDYSNDDGYSDIAMVYLASDVRFTETIRPVCVPDKERLNPTSFIGFTPFAAGWGKTSESAVNGSSMLMEVQLPILANSRCMERFKTQGQLRSTRQFAEGIVCAGSLQGGQDTCRGDSGGPLNLPQRLNGGIFYYELLGVVSYGIGCARAGIPGVYASVPHFSGWIQQKVAERI